MMSLCVIGDTLFAGTDGAGIDIFGRDCRLGNIRSLVAGHPVDAVLSLAADAGGNLWAGTYAGGVAVIDRRGHIRDISPCGISDVRALKILRNGDVLAGCSAGLVLYAPDGQIRRTLYRTDGAIGDDWIRTIHERPDGSIWVGSFGGGISVYDSDFRLLHTLHDWEGLPSNTVYHMVEADGAGVWAATGDGLALINDSVRVDTVIGMADGLADPCVRALCYDLDGNLWMSTTSGISCLDSTGRLSNYGGADGVAGGDFYGASVATTPDGRISFGSHSGVYSFDPVDFRSDSSIVAPVISGITVYGADATDEPYEIYSPGRTVTLPYNQNSLQLDFNVLDPSLASAVNYRYRVDGVDGRWYSVTPGTGLSLRNLSPGEYTVTIEASLRNRFEVAASTSLNIVVVPPVWATWWAKLIYCVLAAAAAIIAFRFYKKRLSLEYELALERRNNRHTERLNAERMRFFTNITHELRTPLTLILGPIEDMKADRGMSQANSRKLTVIHKSALHLLQLINTILEFRKTETQNRDLKVTYADLAAIVAEAGRRYTDLNTNAALTVDTVIAPGDYVQWFDPEVISMIVDNLMSNACKYTSSGRVTLRLRHSCESGVPFTEISVEDTGIGMSQETLRHIFDRYYRDHRAETRLGTGIGLALVCNLVRIHEGEIFVDSELDRGAVFTFRIHTDSTYPEAGRRQDVKQKVGEHTEPEPVAQPDEQRPLILIVEDNVDIVNYISDSLADSYRIVAVSDGAEGLAKAREIYPDMIISDIMMPRMDGISMVRALKENADT
ncbi:MAG: response regulator, partial [Muribaculaceae bacterium]|nr:response regulator [Muribaculaceae bacterium]